MLVNADRHFKMLPTYYLYFNCSKFNKKRHELEIDKKNSREAWKNKSRKGDFGMKNTRHQGQVACKA